MSEPRHLGPQAQGWPVRPRAKTAVPLGRFPPFSHTDHHHCRPGQLKLSPTTFCSIACLRQLFWPCIFHQGPRWFQQTITPPLPATYSLHPTRTTQLPTRSSSSAMPGASTSIRDSLRPTRSRPISSSNGCPSSWRRTWRTRGATPRAVASSREACRPTRPSSSASRRCRLRTSLFCRRLGPIPFRRSGRKAAGEEGGELCTAHSMVQLQGLGRRRPEPLYTMYNNSRSNDEFVFYEVSS